MTRSLFVIALAMVAGASSLLAQDNPLATEVQQTWGRTMRNAVAAAEAMPEDKYDYKPSAESMSFRDLVAHTADSAMRSCSGLNGAMKQAGARDMTKKADLVGAMKAAQAECDTAYGSFTDAKATEMIEGRRGSRSRIGSMYGNNIHIEHEYAQMAVHLRANGVVPPSSAGRR